MKRKSINQIKYDILNLKSEILIVLVKYCSNELNEYKWTYKAADALINYCDDRR